MRQPTKATAQERADALARLRAMIRPGDTVYTVLRDRSPSGMARTIALYVIEDGRPHWIAWTAAVALRERWDDRREGIRVNGAGMDMGFHLAYNLGRVLFPDGFRCSGNGDRRRCQSNEHSNAPWPARDGRRKHRDGGYALRHEWL